MNNYIEQAGIGLNSRREANPYLTTFADAAFLTNLPILTAPMSSVINENNIEIFNSHRIGVVVPRNVKIKPSTEYTISLSLDDFRILYNSEDYLKLKPYTKICIDCANGNMPKLHVAIKEAKVKNKNVILLAGNVCSVVAFAFLADSGVDYIRVGIGGGGVCNTSKNTFIGQNSLAELVSECYKFKINKGLKTGIIADGISTYMNQLLKENKILENGYGAIINLLYMGADLVMLGKLFAECEESCSDKTLKVWLGKDELLTKWSVGDERPSRKHEIYSTYFGMSTHKAQCEYSNDLKHSEGKTEKLEIKWSLDEWLNGSHTKPDELPGFINCLKSAMSYRGEKNVEFFKRNQE